MAVVRHLSGVNSKVGTRGKSAIRAPKGALLIQLSKAGWSLLVTHLEAVPEATQACPGPPSLTKGIACYSSSVCELPGPGLANDERKLILETEKAQLLQG